MAIMASGSRLAISVLLLALVAFAGADDAEDVEENVELNSDGEPERSEGPLGPSEFAQTATLFPDFPDKRIVSGQFVDVLCGFTNVGDKSFNVTQMKGSLNSPFDYNMYIQNFTEIAPFAEIRRGEQGTMHYRFFPDPNLEPRDYILTLSIDYIDADKEEYRTVYFNNTIEIIESQSAVDTRTFYTVVVMLAICGVAAYFGLDFYKKMSSKKAARRVADAGPKATPNSEWLVDAHPVGGAPRKSGSAKKNSKKSS